MEPLLHRPRGTRTRIELVTSACCPLPSAAASCRLSCLLDLRSPFRLWCGQLLLRVTPRGERRAIVYAALGGSLAGLSFFLKVATSLFGRPAPRTKLTHHAPNHCVGLARIYRYSARRGVPPHPALPAAPPRRRLRASPWHRRRLRAHCARRAGLLPPGRRALLEHASRVGAHGLRLRAAAARRSRGRLERPLPRPPCRPAAKY